MSNKNTSDTIPGLQLDQYRKQVNLDEPFFFNHDIKLTDSGKNDIVKSLLEYLINEKFTSVSDIPDEYISRRRMLRALLNIRSALPLDRQFVQKLDRLLQYETKQKNLIYYRDLQNIREAFPETSLKNSDKLILWKGDITCLQVDAIVNAANNQMLGCFQPLHSCIDNIIHSAAGPQLRQDCKTIMDISKRLEQTGDAKITRAYNLPSEYVLHTVGPIIQDRNVPKEQQYQLASCYKNCLSLASQVSEIKSVAFCCISTGVYNFPRTLAAEIAVSTVDEWLSNNSHNFKNIIFNVFLQEDFIEYSGVFGK